MSLLEDLNQIKQARDNIKQAIENKGQTVNKDIRTFAEAISKISGGGSTEGVKLFETVEQMQADPDVKEGDLAVVYRSEMQNWNGEGTITGANFLETVVLPEAFSDYANVMLRSDTGMFDCWGSLSSTSLDINAYTESGSIRISYSSSDGITYTRTDGGDTYVDFGCEVYREVYEPWNDTLGYFFQSGGMVFEGMHQYATHLKTHNFKLPALSGVAYAEDTQYIWDGTMLDTVFTDDILSNLEKSKLALAYAIYYTDKNKFIQCFYTGYGNTLYSMNLYCNNGVYDSMICTSSGAINKQLYIRDYDVATSASASYEFNAEEFTENSKTYYKMPNFSNQFGNIISCMYVSYTGGIHVEKSSPAIFNLGGHRDFIGVNFNDLDVYIYEDKYLPAKTQLNATSEYVYEKTFYGKNGVEEGILGNPDNTFYDINAELVYKIQDKYEKMEPKVMSNGSHLPYDIYFIPTKIDGTALIDTSNMTDTTQLVAYCNNLKIVPKLNTSNATNMRQMFMYSQKIVTISGLDTHNATDLNNMFSGCGSLINLPELDTSNAINMARMFESCYNLPKVPQLNTSKVTNMENMFAYCNKLEAIPELDTSNVTNMANMFTRCLQITSIPMLDTHNVTNMTAMFSYCSKLEAIPELNTSSATKTESMFSGCTNLVDVPQLNTSNVTNMINMFNGCTNLSNESLNNILAMCKNATKITSNKTLQWIGLTQEQANICKTLSNYSSFTSAGWTIGF